MSIKTNHSDESLTPSSGVLKINANGALALPKGLQVDRPAGADAGHLRFSTSLTYPEYYDGTNWSTLVSKTYIDSRDNFVLAQVAAAQSNLESLDLNSLIDVTIAATPLEGQQLVYDSQLAQFRPATVALAPITRSFVGNGTTMEFDIIDSVPSPNNLVVAINGIAQKPFYSYNVIDGHRLVFDEPPENNDIIEVRILKGSATTDRPQPIITAISYSSTVEYPTIISVVATDITYGTGAKINGVPVSRIDYPTSNTLQLMTKYSFTPGQYDLTLVDTAQNEIVYPGAIVIGSSAPYWTNSTTYIGNFNGGDSINFTVGVNNATSVTIGAAAPGDTVPSWLSVSGINLVGTAPINSSPTRYEVKVIATNGLVQITRNYWLVIV